MSYFRVINRGSSIATVVIEKMLMNGHRERLIKISQFTMQGSQDMGMIKKGVQDAGERLSELRLMMEGHQVKIENQFSRLEKEEQRRSFWPILKQVLTSYLGKL
jgi:hypothetical protein